jgi:hypothetical protein
MSRILFWLAGALALALGVMATNASADTSLPRDKHRAGHAPHWAAHHWRGDQSAVLHVTYGGWGYWGPPVVATRRYPGYLYATRRGIVDEACNLPTSACPNEQRDVNY